MQDDPRETVRLLASLAGLPLTEQRLAAAAQTLPMVRAGLAALNEPDYGDSEPAAVFRAPSGPRP